MANEMNNTIANIEVTVRNLMILKDKLQRNENTKFAPNLSEMKMLESRTKTLKKKSAELTTML